MAIVGEAHVEIHTITKAVAAEIRKGLQDAISGEGSRLGKSFSDEFTASVESNLDKSLARINSKLAKEYGKVGSDTGKKFGEEFARSVGDEAEKSGKKFGDSFGKTSTAGVTSHTSKAAKQITDTFESAGDESGKSFVSRFLNFAKQLNKPIAKPDVDTAALDVKIARVRRQIEELNAEKANPRVDLDIRDTLTKKKIVERELEELRKLETSPEVDLKIEQAENKLRRFEARLLELNRRKNSADIDADIGRAEASLAKLEAELVAMTAKKRSIKIDIDSKSLGAAINGVAQLGRSLSMLALPAAIIAATPALSSLTASAVALAGSLYTLPAALGAVGFAIGGLMVGFRGLGDAMGPTGTPAQAKKVQEALDSLAPSARAVAVELRGLGDEAKNLRLDVQQKMFQGLAAEINPLAGIYMPLLQAGLGHVARGFNTAAMEIANYLQTSAGIDTVSLGIDQTSQAAGFLLQSLGPLGVAFFDIFGVGSTYVREFGVWVFQLSRQFQEYIATAKQSGDLNRIIEAGIEVFKQLGQVVFNVGAAIGELMEAANESGSDALGTIVRVTDEIQKFLGSDVGHAGLVAIFQAIRDAVDSLLPGLKAVGTAIAQSIIILQPAIKPVGEAISAVVAALAPLLPQAAHLASVILPPLAAVLQVIAPALGPIAAGFLALMSISRVIGIIQGVTAAMTMFAISQGTMSVAAIGTAGPLAALSGAIRAVGVAIMANPIGFIIGALAALAAALVYCYNNFEGFRNVVDGALNFVKDIAIGVGQWFAGPFVDFFRNAFDWIMGVFQSIGDFFATWGTTILAVLLPFIGIPALIYQNWDGIVTFFTDLWNTITTSVSDGTSNSWTAVTTFFTSLPGMIGGWLSALGSSIASGASAAWNWLTTATSNAIDATLNFIAELPQNIAYGLGFLAGFLYQSAVDGWAQFTTGIENAWNATAAWFVALPDRIATFFTNLGNDFATWATDSWNRFTEALDAAWTATGAWLAALPERIGTFFTNLGNSLYNFAETAWDQFTTGLDAAWSSTVAWFTALPDRIAGFIALVGLGIAIQAKLAWAQFTAGLDAAWSATAAWFAALPDRIGTFFDNLATSFTEWATSSWDGFTTGLETGWNAVGAWFSELPNRISSAFSAAGTWLTTVGNDVIAGLTNGIETAWNGLMSWIVGLIASFIQGFKDGLGVASPSTIFMEIGGFIIQGLINGIQAAASFIWSVITTITSGIISAFMAGISFLQGLWDAFWNGLTIIVQTVGAFLSSIITNLWAGIQIQFNTFVTFVSGLWNGFWSGLQTVVTTVWNGISAFLTTAFATFSALFTAVWTGVQTVFNTVWTFIQNIALTVWGAIQTYFQASLIAYQTMWSTIWNAISSFFGAVWAGIQNIATTVWTAISTFFTSALATFQAFFTTIWTAIQTIFQTVWTFIQTTATTVWNAIAAFFSAAFAAYQAAFQLIWTTIQNIFSTVWTFIQTTATTIWNAIASFFAAAFAAYQAAFQTVWNTIQTIFQTVWTFIQNVATTIWNAIAAFFAGAFAAFQSAFQAIWDTISNIFNTVWTGIQTTATTIWNAISSFFTTQFNTFSNFFTNTWNNIRDAFGRAFGGIQDIATRIWEGVKKIFRDSLNAIIRGVNWPIEKINGLFSIQIPTIPAVQLAEGGDISGRVRGLAGRTADRVPAALSAEEHVWSAKEVDGAGGHRGVRALREAARRGMLNLADGGEVTSKFIPKFEAGAFIVDGDVASNAKNFLKALNGGQPEAVQATGGKRARLPKFALGGALQAGIDFAKSMSGKPYIWGGANPAAGTDCSGYQGMITNVLRGRAPARIGTTATFPWSGFQSGLGSAYSVGAFKGNPGHMAGTLNGVNVESGGSPSRVKYGAGAVGANHGQFTTRAFLPEVGGTFVSGEGEGSIFDPAAWFDMMAATIGLPESARVFLRDVIPDIPSFFEPMGVGTFDKSWEGFRAWVISQLSSVFGTTGPISSVNTGPVVEQVRAVAKQFGWDQGPEWNAINSIISKESSWNPNAANSTSSARGLFQKMTSLHGPVEPSPGGQAQWGLTYIKDRYGTPTAAWAHHQRVGSYDKGGWLKPGITQAINGTGKPEAIIADPMTTFEKSFQKVFKWFAPQCREALEDGISQTSDWVRKLIASLSGKGNTGVKLPGKDANAGPPVIPVLEVPPITIPPIPAPPPAPMPDLPVGDFGDAFKNALSQFAPDLALSIQAGAGNQSAELAKELLGNSERMRAFSESISGQTGVDSSADLAAALQKFADYRDTSVQGPGTGGSGGIDPGDGYDRNRGSGNWLSDRIRSLMNSITSGFTIERGYDDKFQKSRTDTINEMAKAQGKTPQQIVAENPNIANGSDPFENYEKQVRERLSKIPSLAAELGKAFPDISAAIASSENDLRKVLGTRANDLMTYLGTKSKEDADAVLSALGSSAPTAQSIVTKGVETLATPAAQASGAQLTFADGAFQVNINGNADAVTVQQLQSTLSAWGEELVQQYEGRT